MLTNNLITMSISQEKENLDTNGILTFKGQLVYLRKNKGQIGQLAIARDVMQVKIFVKEI